MKVFFTKTGVDIGDNEIDNFRRTFDLKLPAEYVSFLKDVNGGIPLKPFFELRKFDRYAANTNIYLKLDDFFQLGDLSQIFENTRNALEEHDLFPIAETIGGGLICCELADSDNAKTYYYDNDFGILNLTGSLVDFLKLLISESELDYQKYGLGF